MRVWAAVSTRLACKIFTNWLAASKLASALKNAWVALVASSDYHLLSVSYYSFQAGVACSTLLAGITALELVLVSRGQTMADLSCFSGGFWHHLPRFEAQKTTPLLHCHKPRKEGSDVLQFSKC